MNFNDLDTTYLSMNGQRDVSEELLGVALAPMEHATCMTGVALCVGKCGDMPVGVDSCHLAKPGCLFETWHLLH